MSEQCFLFLNYIKLRPWCWINYISYFKCTWFKNKPWFVETSIFCVKNIFCVNLRDHMCLWNSTCDKTYIQINMKSLLKYTCSKVCIEKILVKLNLNWRSALESKPLQIPHCNTKGVLEQTKQNLTFLYFTLSVYKHSQKMSPFKHEGNLLPAIYFCSLSINLTIPINRSWAGEYLYINNRCSSQKSTQIHVTDRCIKHRNICLQRTRKYTCMMYIHVHTHYIKLYQLLMPATAVWMTLITCSNNR